MTSPAAAPPDLPAVLEVKHTLDGREKRFDCRLLALVPEAGHAAVLWVAPAAMHVHGVDLPAGTVSVGHFWTGRHYNVYHWLDQAGETLGYYFNICDQTRITTGLIEWRDLIVDVLALPGRRLDVLDEHELPATLPHDVAAHIDAGKAAILAAPAAVMAEIEAASRAVLSSAVRAAAATFSSLP
jgi:predicted RNA-binding protein associated with RNAse of E/G family